MTITYTTRVTAYVDMTDFDAPALELPGYWYSGRLLIVDRFTVKWRPGNSDDEPYVMFYGRFRLKSGQLGKDTHDVSLSLVTKGLERNRATVYVAQIMKEYPW